jgi:hypothetical protein
VILVAVELDYDPLVEPREVDLEPLDHDIHRRARQGRLVTEPKEAALQLGARLGDWAVVGK